MADFHRETVVSSIIIQVHFLGRIGSLRDFEIRWLSGSHFLFRLVEVILPVIIKSPMYFWRNLLWWSNLSCSVLTASIRLTSVCNESWSALACLRSSSRVSLPRVWISSLVLRGLIALTSSGPTCKSTGPTSVESRGTIILPLLFRLGNFGRIGFAVCPWAEWSTDDPEEESDQSGLAVLFRLASPILY